MAGHASDSDGNGDPLLIDSHGAPVAEPVWALYAKVLEAIGPMATLVEWDNDVPDYEVLRGEARRAERYLELTRAIATPQQTATRS
jgi:hypothetical protein